MSDELLGTYLNDHLAGSELAIETLEECRDHNADELLKTRLEELRIEIEEDRRVLKALIERIEAKQPAIKKAAAWMAEKASRMKLGGGGSDPHETAFRRLQQLELLLTGVNGKNALWRSLEMLSVADSRLADQDYTTLQQRAESQFSRIEEYRIEAVRETFRCGNPIL